VYVQCRLLNIICNEQSTGSETSPRAADVAVRSSFNSFNTLDTSTCPLKSSARGWTSRHVRLPLHLGNSRPIPNRTATGFIVSPIRIYKRFTACNSNIPAPFRTTALEGLVFELLGFSSLRAYKSYVTNLLLVTSLWRSQHQHNASSLCILCARCTVCRNILLFSQHFNT
jgi:hypothetical protein